jgi:hypothetical protein
MLVKERDFSTLREMGDLMLFSRPAGVGNRLLTSGLTQIFGPARSAGWPRLVSL